MGDDTIPSVYIGLKDKLSGIRKVVTESTEKLIQLLQPSYIDTLEEFAKEGGSARCYIGHTHMDLT